MSCSRAAATRTRLAFSPACRTSPDRWHGARPRPRSRPRDRYHPPWPAARRQCSSCTVGTGSRYGLSVCGRMLVGGERHQDGLPRVLGARDRQPVRYVGDVAQLLSGTGRQVACLDMAGTTVADDGTVLEAFAAAVGDLPVDAFERAMTAVRSSMGQSKIEVFRRILGDEAAARKANEAFEDHYAAAVRRGAISAVPGAEDTIMRLRHAGARVCLATGFPPATRDAIIDELAWGGRVDPGLAPPPARRGRPRPAPPPP